MKQLSVYFAVLFAVLLTGFTLTKNFEKSIAVIAFVIALTGFSFAFYFAMRAVITGNQLQQEIKNAL